MPPSLRSRKAPNIITTNRARKMCSAENQIRCLFVLAAAGESWWWTWSPWRDPPPVREPLRTLTSTRWAMSSPSFVENRERAIPLPCLTPVKKSPTNGGEKTRRKNLRMGGKKREGRTYEWGKKTQRKNWIITPCYFTLVCSLWCNVECISFSLSCFFGTLRQSVMWHRLCTPQPLLRGTMSLLRSSEMATAIVFRHFFPYLGVRSFCAIKWEEK